MFENLTNEQVKRIKFGIGIAKRFLEKFLIFTLFNAYVFFLPIFITKDPFEGFYVTKGLVIVGVVFSFMLFYSITRVTTVYYEDMSNRFMDIDPTPDGFGRKVSFILTQKETRCELIAFAVTYLIFPPKFLYSGFSWLFAGFENGFIAKIKVLAISLPIMFILYIFANLSAISYWNKEGRKAREKYKDLSEREIKELKREDKRSQTRFLFALLLGYFLGSVGWMFFVPALLMTLLPILELFTNMKILIIALIIIFFPWSYRNLRALIKRWKFLRSLKKLCREKKYRLSKIQSPYKSLFKLNEGENFSVYIQKRRYSCKFITCKKRSQPIYFMPNGKAAFLVKIRFLKLVLFSYTKSFDYTYEADCKKVIIINPIPQRVLLPRTEFNDLMDESNMLIGKSGHRLFASNASGDGPDSHELDNGDIVGGHELYSARAFLNALERDCIDKD